MSSRAFVSAEKNSTKTVNMHNLIICNSFLIIYEVYETFHFNFVLFIALPGEVFDYLVAHGRMKEKEARAKFRQVGYSVCLSVRSSLHG